MRGGGDGIPVGGRTGEAASFDSFVMCGELALGGLGAVCLEENVCLSVDACFIGLESSKAENVISNAVDKVESENV